MKITRFRHSLGWMFEARTVRGWIGIGHTPQLAVLAVRHEFRQFADHAEQGKCQQGRFHKRPKKRKK